MNASHAADWVALLRGINVGRAKTIAMPELVAVFDSLGCADVRTVLRSGNVVFSAPSEPPDPRAIEAAVLAATGVQSSVLVLSAARFRAIAAANPLLGVVSDGSKGFVTFLSEPQDDIRLPDAASLAPEILSADPDAIYQWIPDGSLQTRVSTAFWKQFSGHVTTRNVNTVDKLVALLDSRQD